MDAWMLHHPWQSLLITAVAVIYFGVKSRQWR